MATVLAHADVLARRHPAAGRLLRQVLRVRRRREGGAVAACRVRRARQRGRRLLLRAHRQDHVLRRAEGEVPRRSGQGRRWSWGSLASSCCSTWCGRRPSSMRVPTRPPELCSRIREPLDRTGRPHPPVLSQRHSRGGRLHQHGSLQARRRPARRGPCGSWRGARRRVAAARAGTGPPEPGNLYASLLQRLACPQSVVHQLSLLAGVAVVEAIAAAAGGAGLRPAD